MRRLSFSVRWLTVRIGRRGAALLVFAFIDLVYGVSMVFPTDETRTIALYQFAATMLPLAAWGLLWTAVGVCCLVQAFMRRDSSAFAAAIAIKVCWALLLLVGWGSGEIPRGYVSVAIWTVFAGLVSVIASWPEPPPRPLRDRDLASSEAVVSADAAGRVTAWNSAAVRLFGWSAVEILGKSLTVLIPPESREAHLAGFARAVAARRSDLSGRVLKMTALRRDGERIEVELTLSIWERGSEVSFTGLVRHPGGE